VGRVIKPHGLRGEVHVELWGDPCRLEPGSQLSSAQGPLTVEMSRPHQGRYLVRFAGVDDWEHAEAIRGLALEAPPLDRPGELWVHELVGSRVRTADGEDLGTVEAVEANPASDLLVVEGGGLIPLHFVVGHEPGVSVTVDIPEGLLD
jgi:16S rRNA processing protein RimM